jgi:SAM-dependent methyltransferase
MYDQSAVVYDAIYRAIGKDYRAESAKVADLIRIHCPKARSLLDVACGTGGHLECFRREFEVTGVELSPQMAAIARRKLPEVAVHVGDMRSFDLGCRFDAVTCLFSAIGYMRTPQDLHLAVANLVRHANPGGVVIIEPWLSPEAWWNGPPTVQVIETPELSVARMNTRERCDHLSIMEFHYLVGTADRIEHFVERHEMGLFRLAEYQAELAASGWTTFLDEVGLTGRGLVTGIRMP